MLTNRQLDDFKSSLRQCEEMDRFEMLDKLRLLRVTDLAKDDNQYIRLLLKKTLIEEILREFFSAEGKDLVAVSWVAGLKHFGIEITLNI